MITAFIILLCATHCMFSIFGTRKISKSILLNKNKKIINLILLWCIPFFWYWILLTILKRTPGSQEFTKEEKYYSSQYYESGKGSPGAGISNK